MKKLNFKFIFPAICLCLALALEVLACSAEAFTVFYVDKVFPIITLPLSFISGLFPFSVGEILIELGAVLLFVGVVASIVAAVPKVMRAMPKIAATPKDLGKERKGVGSMPTDLPAMPKIAATTPETAATPKDLGKERKDVGKEAKKVEPSGWEKYLIVYKKYMTLLWFLIGVYSLIMVLNCFILYQYPPMHMASADDISKELTDSYDVVPVADVISETADGSEELSKLRDMVVLKANYLATQMERNEKGEVIGKSREELISLSKASMRKLADEGYPRLSGFYPDFKYFNDSKFFSKQDMLGYYFPYSMEANVNRLMYSTNFPHSICHELSHLKGYLLEDEANFIGYLACMESGDDLFEYSAILSVLGYIDNDFFDSLGRDFDKYFQHPVISDMVLDDDIFLTDEVRRMVDDSGILDSETVKKASNTFTDTVLTTNGVSDGIKSYSRVVQLLVDYYSQPENVARHF